jgi:site-specific DNA-methyltransferase (cytosine-N4-specific)
VDRDPDLLSALEERVATAPERSRTIAQERLAEHRSWVEQRRADGKEPGYEAEQYDFAVNTKQEQRIQFYAVDAVTATDDGFRAVHEPVE